MRVERCGCLITCMAGCLRSGRRCSSGRWCGRMAVCVGSRAGARPVVVVAGVEKLCRKSCCCGAGDWAGVFRVCGVCVPCCRRDVTPCVASGASCP